MNKKRGGGNVPSFFCNTKSDQDTLKHKINTWFFSWEIFLSIDALFNKKKKLYWLTDAKSANKKSFKKHLMYKKKHGGGGHLNMIHVSKKLDNLVSFLLF